MPILAERGYIIPAVGDQYTRCAEQLAQSLWQFHPAANITIVTVDMLPYGDLGGWANDWQMFSISPYRQTIKLEADMIVASPVDHWWSLFENRDVVISQGCRDFYGQSSSTRTYRKCFDLNHLPDVYNAVTYWRLSLTAKEFFELVRHVFEHWTEFRKLLKFADEQPSTDVVYAMVAKIMGPERVTLPAGLGPNIVHMKRHVNPIKTDDWTRELIWETDPLRINTIAQQGFVHYHKKDWSMQ